MQATGASPSAATIQQTETLLNTASLSTGDALAWMVLNGSDQIVAASPTSSEGQSLATATAILTDPSLLDKFVQAQRSAPAPKPGQSVLAVTSGLDDGLTDKVWVATLAFTSPGTPSQSGVVLAVFSLPAIANMYLSALPTTANSYAALFDSQGTLLGTVGNQKLAQQVGQPLSIAPLQDVLHSVQAGQGSSEQIYTDPTTGVNEAAAGATLKDLGWVVLVVAPPEALAPATTGLLAGRNATTYSLDHHCRHDAGGNLGRAADCAPNSSRHPRYSDKHRRCAAVGRASQADCQRSAARLRYSGGRCQRIGPAATSDWARCVPDCKLFHCRGDSPGTA